MNTISDREKKWLYAQSLGKLCKDSRVMAKVSQKEVSEKTGYSQSTISSLESGTRISLPLILWYMHYLIPVSETTVWLDDNLKGIINEKTHDKKY